MPKQTRAQLGTTLLALIQDNTNEDITPAEVRSVLTDILDSSPNLAGEASSRVRLASAMGALAIDVTKDVNSKPIAGNVAVTLVGTLTAGLEFSIEFTNTDTNSRVVTLPNTPDFFDVGTQTNRTTFSILPGGTESLTFRYDGTRFLVYNMPSASYSAPQSIASATTTDIGASSSANVVITGTTQITGFGTAPAGTPRKGRFAGALTLTHNATSLILPGGANIVTAAGDTFWATSEGSGNWRVDFYQKANGQAVVGSAGGVTTPAAGGTGINNGTKTVTLGGNLQTAGAFDTIIRSTSATDVTLPTTGILATTSQLPLDNTINDQLADYTFVLSDRSKTVNMNVGTANNVTVPPNSSVAYPVGQILLVNQKGAGTTTIVAGGGVTITPPPGGSLVSAGQHAKMALVQVAIDSWELAGDLMEITTALNKTANYTLALSDAQPGKIIEMNMAGANSLTIPTNAAVPIPVGYTFNAMQRGAGLTSFVTTGLTFNARGATKSAGQGAYWTFRKVGTDTWDAFGDITA